MPLINFYCSANRSSILSIGAIFKGYSFRDESVTSLPGFGLSYHNLMMVDNNSNKPRFLGFDE